MKVLSKACLTLSNRYYLQTHQPNGRAQANAHKKNRSPSRRSEYYIHVDNERACLTTPLPTPARRHRAVTAKQQQHYHYEAISLYSTCSCEPVAFCPLSRGRPRSTIQVQFRPARSCTPSDPALASRLSLPFNPGAHNLTGRRWEVPYDPFRAANGARELREGTNRVGGRGREAV